MRTASIYDFFVVLCAAQDFSEKVSLKEKRWMQGGVIKFRREICTFEK